MMIRMPHRRRLPYLWHRVPLFHWVLSCRPSFSVTTATTMGTTMGTTTTATKYPKQVEAFVSVSLRSSGAATGYI